MHLGQTRISAQNFLAGSMCTLLFEGRGTLQLPSSRELGSDMRLRRTYYAFLIRGTDILGFWSQFPGSRELGSEVCHGLDSWVGASGVYGSKICQYGRHRI